MLETLNKRSYVPYSGTHSACAVAGSDGSIFPGVRIENISYPLTIPAVQCGVFTCLNEGEQPETIYINKGDEPDLNYWTEQYGLRVSSPDELNSTALKPIIANANGGIRPLLLDQLDRAIVPNSQFRVAAVLESGEGLIGGSNIEQESWNLGLCAERIVLAKALAYGVTDFKALHIQTLHGDYSSPCGACRQVIVEHMPRIPVYIHHSDGTTSRHFSNDLLPYSFKSDFLMKFRPGDG